MNNTKIEYVVAEVKDIPNSFVLGQISYTEKMWHTAEGIPRSATWPSGVTHSVSKDFPNDMLLVDVFRSPHQFLLISTRLKDFLVKQECENVEFLPVSILDHKGKIAGEYFILHPIMPVDCLDVEASEAKPHIMDDSIFHAIARIALIPSKIEMQRKIFKIKGLVDLVIFRKDLAQEIDAQGFTGIGWRPLSEFNRC